MTLYNNLEINLSWTYLKNSSDKSISSWRICFGVRLHISAAFGTALPRIFRNWSEFTWSYHGRKQFLHSLKEFVHTRVIFLHYLGRVIRMHLHEYAMLLYYREHAIMRNTICRGIHNYKLWAQLYTIYAPFQDFITLLLLHLYVETLVFRRLQLLGQLRRRDNFTN